MINNVSVQGRLTADPEVNYTNAENIPVCNFCIAVARPKRKGISEDETDFFYCVAWRGRAEVVTKWFKKGDMIGIVGKLRNESYVDKNNEKRTVTKILVSEIHFCGGRKDGNTHNVFEGMTDVPPEDIGEFTADDDFPF